jgi:RNA-directed DNA polymerase
VLDQWFEHQVKPRLANKTVLVRYADDAVFLFANEQDARRVLAVLPKRLAKYGLTLHPTKTRLTAFRRPDRMPPSGGGRPGPGTFDLLGFTHFWGKSRQGKWIVKRQTARDRFGRALSRVAAWCRGHRHDAVRDQHRTLAAKLRGHFQYFGITGNWRMLARFRLEVIHAWRKWLNRRSQRASMSWERMGRLLERYSLPKPRIAHRFPSRAANP